MTPRGVAQTVRSATLPLALVLALVAPSAQHKGTILFVGSSIFHRWTQLTAQMAPLPVENIAFDGAVTDDGVSLTSATRDPARALAGLANKSALAGLRVQGATLEDVFLKLTGHGIRD